jgi:hypothetical protein
MQFDLFESGRDTGLRYDLLNALEQFDVPAARTAFAILIAAFPQDATRTDMLCLIDVAEQRDTAPFTDHEAVAVVRARLHRVETTALQMFGASNGRNWLAQLWRETAIRATNLPFLAKESENHAAALYLCAGDWSTVENAVTAIPSWRRIPAPLAWMAEAQYRRCGLEAAFPLLCELAWMVPERFGELVTRLADPVIASLLKKFHAGFEGDDDGPDLAWFPAWSIIENDTVVAWLRNLSSLHNDAPMQATKTLIELWGLERRGTSPAVVERRKRLQGLQASLYAAYMKTR